MFKQVIFDLDGTILDGTKGILNSLKKTIKKFNIDIPNEDMLTSFIGPPLQKTCKTFFNFDEKSAQDFTDAFRKTLVKKDIYKANIYDGCINLLKFLKSKNIKLGIATYKREDLVITLLKHFGLDLYFDSICGADNKNKLRKIDILKNCMTKLAEEKEKTILIGDSFHDGEAAKYVGIQFIAVTYGFGFKTKEETLKYNPILVANNVEDIINYFKKIISF